MAHISKEVVKTLEALRDRHNRHYGYLSDLSKATGIPRDRIYQWVNGRGKPRLEVAKEVLAAIGKLDEHFDTMTYTTTVSSSKAMKPGTEKSDPKPSPSVDAKIAAIEKDLATLKAQLDLLIRLQSGK